MSHCCISCLFALFYTKGKTRLCRGVPEDCDCHKEVPSN